MSSEDGIWKFKSADLNILALKNEPHYSATIDHRVRLLTAMCARAEQKDLLEKLDDGTLLSFDVALHNEISRRKLFGSVYFAGGSPKVYMHHEDLDDLGMELEPCGHEYHHTCLPPRRKDWNKS